MFMLLFDTDPKCIFNEDVHKFFLCVKLRARINFVKNSESFSRFNAC